LKQQFTIVSRGSHLALAQVEIFKQKVWEHFPSLQFETIIQASKGDLNVTQSLQEITQPDFFSKEIHEAVSNGTADFAVHSYKDVSHDALFEGNVIAVIDRNDPRDVAIFNPDIQEKIKKGETIRIGTCSSRRTLMKGFLEKALPQLHPDGITISIKPLRGNVDGRLRKLSAGEYDGIILAIAGINRLLDYKPSSETMRSLLQDKKLMVLPLIECTPAPAQATIVAEALAANTDAVTILQQIHRSDVANAVQQERNMISEDEQGCNKAFGAIHRENGKASFTYISGEDEHGQPLQQWQFEEPAIMESEHIFAATDHMSAFFNREAITHARDISHFPVVYIAHHNAVTHYGNASELHQHILWTAGTHTWRALARQGFWIQGCADSLGLKTLLYTWQNSLLNIDATKVMVLTNETAAAYWQLQGWNSMATYRLLPQPHNEAFKKAVTEAAIFFWTNYQQYASVQHLLPERKVLHCCAAGETWKQFNDHHIPVIPFPSIKAFTFWREKITIATIEE